MATNRGLIKLKAINAEAQKIKEKAGYKIVKQPDKKIYKMKQTEAISIATDRLFGKNKTAYMDGVSQRKKSNSKGATANTSRLKKITAEAKKLRESKGYRIVKGKKVYKMAWTDAVKAASKKVA